MEYLRAKEENLAMMARFVKGSKFQIGDKVDFQWAWDSSISRSGWRIVTVRAIRAIPDASWYHEYTIETDGERYCPIQKEMSYMVEPLHTKTPRHYYLEHPKSKICNVSVNKKKIRTCSRCKEKCCLLCNLCKLHGLYFCPKCIEIGEHDMIYKAVHSSSLCGLNTIASSIIECIAQFAMFGIDVRCCNDDCSKSISLKTRFDLKYNKDVNGRKIYKYYIEKAYHESHGDDVGYKVGVLDGEIMRVFCGTCCQHRDNKFRYCSKPRCPNQYLCVSAHPDDADATLWQYDGNCFNHPLCTVCKDRHRHTRYKERKCRFCDKYYCEHCGLMGKQKALCKDCEILHSFKMYKELLYLNVGHIIGEDVTNLIALFCRGYATVCCHEACNDAIVMNSQSEFANNRDSEGNVIYKYELPKQLLLGFKTYSLFGRQGRMFCAECTANRIGRCKMMNYGEWQICRHRDSGAFCKNHALCGAEGYEFVKGYDGYFHRRMHCKFDEEVDGYLLCRVCLNGAIHESRPRWLPQAPPTFRHSQQEKQKEDGHKLTHSDLWELTARTYNGRKHRERRHRRQIHKQRRNECDQYRQSSKYFRKKREKASYHKMKNAFKNRYQLMLDFTV